MKTIFRKFRGEILAVFPYQLENAHSDFSMCYAHLGQHSVCDYRYIIAHSKPATKEEYTPLLNELSQIGYDVKLISRVSARAFSKYVRLEAIRYEIQRERISYGEIAELQSLKRYIDKNDVELLQWVKPQ